MLMLNNLSSDVDFVNDQSHSSNDFAQSIPDQNPSNPQIKCVPPLPLESHNYHPIQTRSKSSFP